MLPQIWLNSKGHAFFAKLLELIDFHMDFTHIQNLAIVKRPYIFPHYKYIDNVEK